MARDTRAKIEAMSDKLEPRLAAAFLNAFNRVRSRVTLSRIEVAVQTGSFEDLVDLLSLNPSDAAQIGEQVREAFMVGGNYEASKAPAGIFRFNGINQQALEAMSGSAATLVAQINEATRQAVAEVMRQGLISGRNPKSVALDLVGRIGTNGRRQGGIIGLNGPQTKYVANMRTALAEGDLAGYRAKTLRDKRFDKQVEKLLREGKKIPAQLSERITGRYSDRLLRSRGETIGREAIGHLNAGRLEATRQAVEQGVVEERDTYKIWHSTGDNKDRDTHAAMNGQKRLINELFESPSGARLEGPQDSSHGAGAEETVNCRCWMEIYIDFIGARRRRRAELGITG